MIESFFAVKKEEAERFPSYSDAKMALFDYIEVGYAARKLDQSAARKVGHLKGGSFYALLI